MSHISRLFILHTNDVHSCFENMPKLAARIAQYRQTYLPDELLTVDCGDHLDRVRLETEGTGGLANIAVLNESGYELFVPGNNEGLTFPKAIFENVFREHANFSVLGTNMLELQTGSVPPWMFSRLIINKSGFRIGIIGVTASFNDFYRLLGWNVTEPQHAIAEAVSELRAKVELVLVVSHVGLIFDRQLAELVPGIDCIIGGHTHHLLEQAEQIGQTTIGAAGKSGTHLGVIEIEYDPVDLTLKHIAGHAENVTDEKDEPRVAAIIESYRSISLAAMQKQITVLDEPIPHNLRTESELGNLLADGLRKWTESEVGIVNSGQLLNGLSSGTLTHVDLLSVCPSPINPCSVMLYGSELVLALEQSLMDEYIDMAVRGYGFRGKVLGSLCVSGMDIIYDKTSPDFHKIKSVWIGNQPIEPERLYKVGTIDMFTFGVGYPTLGTNREIHYYLPEFIRDVLQKELASPIPNTYRKQLHWKQTSF